MQHDTVNKEYFVEAILDGDTDSFLGAISAAIKERKESLNNRKILFINIGDTVRFNKSTRPKYLQGLEATVVKVNQKSVVVKIKDADGRARRYGYGEFRTPISLVDKVEV